MPVQWNVVDPNAPRTLADIFNPESQRMRAAKLQGTEEQAQGLELQNIQRAQQIQEAQQKATLAPQVREQEKMKQMELYSRQIDSMIANDLNAGLPRDVIKQRASTRAKQLGLDENTIGEGLKDLDLIKDDATVYKKYLFAADPEAARKEQIKKAFETPKPMEAPKTVTYKSGGKEITEEWDAAKGVWRRKGVSDITGGAGEGPKLTEAQAKATTFASQMAAASNELGVLENAGYDPASLSAQAETKVAGGVANLAVSEEAQRAKQAQNQWSEAFLRVKTGAAATQPEVELNNKTFFPQVGDGPETIKQKRRMREQAERDVLNMAGPGRGLATPRQPQQTTFSADKEARYQEWKRKQGL